MRIIILILLVISGLTAVACSSEAPPPADTHTASRPTANVPATVEAGASSTREAESAIDATVEAKVAATLTTSTSTPGPTNTPAATTLSLDEYLTLCATTDIDLADDATYGDLSSELAAEADRFEALTPPAQLSEWHLLNIEAYRMAQAVLDTQPTDDVIDFNNPTMNTAEDDFEEKLREAVARVPKDVLQQMIAAGCIDSYLVPDDYEYLPDDHGNSEGDATAIRVGADVLGTLDYDDDIDFFRFQALRGQVYRIYVARGTLDDSILELYDVDGSFLDSSLDRGGPFADGIYWEAPSNGERYVAVTGVFGIGSYTLTVSLADPIDDHGNSGGRATEITGPVDEEGAGARGAVDYDGDIDYFRFYATHGYSYQIDVALRTLDDSIVDLYDADGSLLDSNDNYGGTFASRLHWEAPANGDFYVAVEGRGIGTYTLMVSIVDDHSSDFESATRIAIGESVRIVLHNYDDRDVLVFSARPGTEYVFTLDFHTGERRGEAAGTTMALYDAGGRVLASLDDYDFSEQRIRNKIIWHAVTGGDLYIVVGNEDAFGIFALTLTER